MVTPNNDGKTQLVPEMARRHDGKTLPMPDVARARDGKTELIPGMARDDLATVRDLADHVPPPRETVEAFDARVHREVGRVLEAIGDRVRDARLRAALSEEAAAARAKISAQRWREIEAGAVNPTVQTVVRVANAVGVSAWNLLGVVAQRRQA